MVSIVLECEGTHSHQNDFGWIWRNDSPALIESNTWRKYPASTRSPRANASNNNLGTTGYTKKPKNTAGKAGQLRQVCDRHGSVPRGQEFPLTSGTDGRPVAGHAAHDISATWSQATATVLRRLRSPGT